MGCSCSVSPLSGFGFCLSVFSCRFVRVAVLLHPQHSSLLQPPSIQPVLVVAPLLFALLGIVLCTVSVITVIFCLFVSCWYGSLSPVGPLRIAVSYIAFVQIIPLSPVAGLGPSRYCYYCSVYAASTVL